MRSRNLIVILVAATILSSATVLIAPARAQSASPRTRANVLVDDTAANHCLQTRDLAGLERSLTAAQARFDALHPAEFTSPQNQQSMLRSLREDLWPHLLWALFNYRLRALEAGLYRDTLDLAGRIAPPDAARETLRLVHDSYDHLSCLLPLVERPGCFDVFDPPAQSILPDYPDAIVAFGASLTQQEPLLLARIERGERPQVVDPATFAADPSVASRYEELQDEFAGDQRWAPILGTIVSYDPQTVQDLVVYADTTAQRPDAEFLLNAAAARLLAFEDALVAAQTDSSVRLLFSLFDQRAHWYTSPLAGGLSAERDAFALVARVRERMAAMDLRAFYATGDRVRTVAAEVRRRPARAVGAAPVASAASFALDHPDGYIDR